MSDWVKHEPGAPCPLPPGTVIKAQLEDGYTLSPMRADQIDWCCPGDEVIKYRIIE